jgi:hypothetical protein
LPISSTGIERDDPLYRPASEERTRITARISLGLALLVGRKLPGRVIFRTLFFLP